MKTYLIPVTVCLLLFSIAGCVENKGNEECNETKWPQEKEELVAVKAKLPSLMIAGTDTIPITSFASVRIYGSMNKVYCDGTRKGEVNIELAMYNNIDAVTYYLLAPKYLYKFQNDEDGVEVQLRLEATTYGGDVYRANEDYKRYSYADIHLDIYDFYKYCEFVFTNQSTVWVKQ